MKRFAISVTEEICDDLRKIGDKKGKVVKKGLVSALIAGIAAYKAGQQGKLIIQDKATGEEIELKI